ncbi:MAG: T9SS type A sorting domain-containing protein [Bacteroidales bacterium]
MIVPASTYLTIPTGANVRLTGTDSLTIQSTASGTGSLICNGTFAGPAKVERYMTGAKWHIVSSPVTGQSFSSFITNSANNIPWLSGTNPVQYGIMEYDEPNDKWSIPFTAAKSGNFVTSQGYSVRNRADGKITFKGNIMTANQTVTLTRGKYGWNCIGNPFTSTIQVKGLGGILSDNIADLDQNYAGIYIWDEQANYNNSGLKKDYRVHCNTPYTFPFNIQENSDTYVAVGQAFFMKSKSSGGTFTFKQSMKTHQTGVTFRSTQGNWPAVRLQANGNNLVSTTVVAFNESMSKGLDPSYDVGMLKGNPAFALYSRLIDSDGFDYAVQALPDTISTEEIPIGLDCTVGTSVTFKMEKAFLSEGCDVILEDRQKSIFTEFEDEDSFYTTDIASNNTGIGRFYIHITNLGTGTLNYKDERFLVYGSSGKIIVKGNLREISSVDIYTTDGKIIDKITPNNEAIFQSKCYTKGVYIVKLTNSHRNYSRRVIL